MPIEFEKLNDTEPVHVQLTRQIKDRIASERLRNGDALPSRRELAAALGINPNTVQKVYKQLEDEGLVSTLQASHSVVTALEDDVMGLRRAMAAESANNFAARMKELGLDFREAVGLLGESWDK